MVVSINQKRWHHLKFIVNFLFISVSSHKVKFDWEFWMQELFCKASICLKHSETLFSFVSQLYALSVFEQLRRAEGPKNQRKNTYYTNSNKIFSDLK